MRVGDKNLKSEESTMHVINVGVMTVVSAMRIYTEICADFYGCETATDGGSNITDKKN